MTPAISVIETGLPTGALLDGKRFAAAAHRRLASVPSRLGPVAGEQDRVSARVEETDSSEEGARDPASSGSLIVVDALEVVP